MSIEMIPDETLAALMETYRIKVSQLTESLDHAEFRAENAEREKENLQKEHDRKTEWLKEKREELRLSEGEVAKLQNVIETLKIELQNERQAHTETRAKLADTTQSQEHDDDQD